MDKPRVSDTEVELRQPLAARVAAYTLAAAAGLGIVSGPELAKAEIVYTPARIHFERGVLLDLNHDGIIDFRITQSGLGGTRHWLWAGGAPGNGVRGPTSALSLFALRLSQGAKIGPGERFYRGAFRGLEMATFYSTTFGTVASLGPWAGYHRGKNGVFGFLGVEFKIDSEVHYGWIRIDISCACRPEGYRGVVTGYAYNTVPNQPIRAGQTSNADTMEAIPPQPATLGVLALGSPGLDIWRPRRCVANE